MAESWNRYGATAARPAMPPGHGIRPRVRTIDIHSHVWVPAAAAFMKPHATLSSRAEAHAETQELGRRQETDRRPRMIGTAERVPDLDAMGIDVQVIQPAPGQCYHAASPDVAATAARLVNDGMAAFAAQAPGRFIPFGTVPMQDGALAAAELGRCVHELGFKGVQILTNVNGREVSDPAFAPFWARAEALGALVVLHPTGFTEPRRFGPYYFGNVIGNPLDTTMALHHLIFSGVLERHPALRILAVHGGGYLPGYIGRMDHAWGARSDARAGLPRPPSEYLRRLYVDSIVFTAGQLESLVRLFGAERVLMGTDYPYDMGEYDPVGHLGACALDQDQVDAIAGGNAARLLGL